MSETCDWTCPERDRMDATQDPRKIITPASFSVAPELIGLPLARPWRRAAALFIDLIFCALLVGFLSEPSILFAALAAGFVFWLTGRKPSTVKWRRMVRGIHRTTAAIVVFGTLIPVIHKIVDRKRPEPQPDPSEIRIEHASIADLGITLGDVTRLARAKSEEDARVVSDRIVTRLASSGVGPEEAREIRLALGELGPRLNPTAIAALSSSLEALEASAAEERTATALNTDSLAVAYATALTTKDSARAERVRQSLAMALAADTIATLHKRNERLARQVDRLEARIDVLSERENRRKTLAGNIGSLLDYLGIGFGWTALYFTALLTLWRGRTPGKRLLGIRVIRLDGKPIGWWVAFERFGGYAAGLLTGFVGFLQVTWDRNRQAIHDKISSTVVVRG